MSKASTEPFVIFTNWAKALGVILALIVTATSIFNTYLHYQIYPVISRVEKLEDASIFFKEVLKNKVDDHTLKIYLANLNKKLDELTNDIKWLIKRG